MAAFDGASKVEGGIKFKGVTFKPVVEQCEGCSKIAEFEGEKFCTLYPAPDRKWAQGRCNSATHVKVAVAEQVKVNPLKASKRAARGR